MLHVPIASCIQNVSIQVSHRGILAEVDKLKIKKISIWSCRRDMRWSEIEDDTSRLDTSVIFTAGLHETRVVFRIRGIPSRRYDTLMVYSFAGKAYKHIKTRENARCKYVQRISWHLTSTNLRVIKYKMLRS